MTFISIRGFLWSNDIVLPIEGIQFLYILFSPKKGHYRNAYQRQSYT